MVKEEWHRFTSSQPLISSLSLSLSLSLSQILWVYGRTIILSFCNIIFFKKNDHKIRGGKLWKGETPFSPFLQKKKSFPKSNG